MSKGTHPRTALGQTAAQMIRRYYLHDVARDSAALTYYLLFAIFPLLIFVSTLLGILELDVDSIVTGLRQIVPGDVAEVVRGYLEYVSGNASRQLMWFSLVFSIWFPMRATGCLLHSLRKAFGKGQPQEYPAGSAENFSLRHLAHGIHRPDAADDHRGPPGAVLCVGDHHRTGRLHQPLEQAPLRGGGAADVRAGDGAVYAGAGPPMPVAGGGTGRGRVAGGVDAAVAGLLLLCGKSGTLYPALRLHRHHCGGAAVAVYERGRC